MHSRLAIFLIAAAALPTRAAPAADLTLEIRHLWQGQVLELPAAGLPTAAGDRIEITRLAYLLSSPRIAGEKHGRTEWLQREHWQAFVDGTVPGRTAWKRRAERSARRQLMMDVF